MLGRFHLELVIYRSQGIILLMLSIYHGKHKFYIQVQFLHLQLGKCVFTSRSNLSLLHLNYTTICGIFQIFTKLLLWYFLRLLHSPFALFKRFLGFFRIVFKFRIVIISFYICYLKFLDLKSIWNMGKFISTETEII